MKRRGGKKPDVRAKTRKICAAIGHVWPPGPRVFPRCVRCGDPLR